MLKRFRNHELGESASRRVGYDSIAEYAKSSRSTCRVCNKYIEQGLLRLALMLQDDEGYKNTSWTHFECFWKHPESRKLRGTHEIRHFSQLKVADQKKISAEFDKLHSKGKAGKTLSKKKKKQDDDEEEEFTPPAKRTRASLSQAAKRKPNADAEE